VPDGYTIKSTTPWEGTLSTGDVLIAQIGSAKANPGSTSPDYDLSYTNLNTGVGTDIVSPLWTQTAVSATATIPGTAPYAINLEVGGNHVSDPGGTVFGLQVAVTYATAGFNPADAALTLQLGNTLTPFGWSKAFETPSWTGSGTLELEQGVTALSWTIVQLGTGIGSSGGTPNYYYTGGFATPTGTWGAERSTRVSFSPQLMRLPSATSSVQFFLPIGMVLDIIQLVPSAGVSP
jgi:hypothetical protein